MKDIQIRPLTEGPILKNILRFTAPLLLGNLFQQLYNTTDSFIVGNYVGNTALAAIGASTQVINLLIGFVIGMTAGAGIVIAQYYGASDRKQIHQAIHTSFWFCILGGILVTFLGILFSPGILTLMHTPSDAFQDADLYLRIYFLGTLFNILYNMGAGVLQAIGDTRHPLYYLFISSITNILLDILFVAVFHWDILGVAAATFIAQGVSAFLVLWRLCHTDAIYQLNLKEIRCNPKMLVRILRFGIPTGLQTTIVSLSNVVVQSYLNQFGTLAMAGSNIYGKVDGFVLLPVNCLSLTTTTYIAQNIGAHQYNRVKKGMAAFLLVGNVYSAAVGILLFFFSRGPLSLFVHDPQVIRYGVMMGKVLGPGYFLLITCQILIGTARGAGETLSTMVLSILNLCGLRILWLAVMIPLFPSIYTLYLGYPITWATAALSMAIYYFKKVKPRLDKEKAW